MPTLPILPIFAGHISAHASVDLYYRHHHYPDGHPLAFITKAGLQLQYKRMKQGQKPGTGREFLRFSFSDKKARQESLGSLFHDSACSTPLCWMKIMKNSIT
ncbi:MAG: hypothetical protein U5L96_02755 [Owenweeksia sp.]|nr:hypothetical protein [Owenweeksia sp.]